MKTSKKHSFFSKPFREISCYPTNLFGAWIFFVFFMVCSSGSNLLFGQFSCETDCNIPNPLREIRNSANPENTGTPLTLRLYIWIVRHTDGSGGISVSEVPEILESIGNHFSTHNIYFALACTDFVDNSFYYSNRESLFASSYTQDNGINLYLFPGDGGLAIIGDVACWSGVNDHSTISHEIGHCLGLFHTFHGSPYDSELAGGLPEFVGRILDPANPNSCFNTGDGFCDTNADPLTSLGLDLSDCSWDTPMQTDGTGNFLYTDPAGMLFTNTDVTNIMSYGRECKSQFTTEQGQGMCDMITGDIDLIPTQVNDATISSNTTWTVDQYFDVDVTIKAPNVLTVKSKIEMAPGTKINVEAGAKIIIDGGHLTVGTPGGCAVYLGDTFWKGIALKQSTTSSTGGLAELKNNAKIEHADAAFFYEYSTPGGSYGSVTAHDADFINNRSTVNFFALEPQTTSTHVNSFSSCTFTVDENFMDDDFVFHVYLANVRNSYFGSCEFEDTEFQNHLGLGSGAVFAFDSRITVQSTCGGCPPPQPFPCPSSCFLQSKIDGFRNGIFLSGMEYFNIDDVEFDNFQRAINLEGTGLGRIIDNDIEISSYPVFPRYGIETMGATGFIIKDNTISANFFTSTNIGIFIGDSGEDANEIRGNSFSALRNGIIAFDKNNSSSTPSIGLKFNCNTHDNSAAFPGSSGPFDFSVWPNSSVASIQGSQQIPAGNVFTQTNNPVGSDFNNHVNNDEITYFFNVNGIQEEPVNVINIEANGIFEGAGCSSGGDGFPNGSSNLNDYDQYYLSNINQFSQLKTQYFSSLDGGNSQNLLNLVNSATDGSQLTTDLLNLSPYLSENVLMAMYDRYDILTDTDRFNILAANPDELRKASVKNYLQNASNPLSGTELSSLFGMTSTITERTQLEGNLGHYKNEANRAVNGGLAVLYQADILDYNLIRQWLAKKQGFESEILIAHTYYREGKLTDLTAFLPTIPLNIELSTRQTEDYNYYVSFMNIIVGARNAGRLEASLTETEIQSVYDIAVINDRFVCQYAKNFLEVYYDYDFDEEESQNSESSSENWTKEEPERVVKSSGDIQVYPNPADNVLFFQLPKTEETIYSKIEIHDTFGKLVNTLDIPEGQFLITLNTETMNPGVYYYSAFGIGKNPSVKTFIITR